MTVLIRQIPRIIIPTLALPAVYLAPRGKGFSVFIIPMIRILAPRYPLSLFYFILLEVFIGSNLRTYVNHGKEKMPGHVLSKKITHPGQAQTPQQRKANERYAKQESAKRGKSESVVKQKQKSNPPISKLWIGKPPSIKGLGYKCVGDCLHCSRSACLHHLRWSDI